MARKVNTKRPGRRTAAEIQTAADRAEGQQSMMQEAAVAAESKEEIARDLEEARRLFEEAQARAVAAGIASPAVHVEKTNSSTVWIGCKLPNGLLLQLHEETQMDRPVVGGGIKPVKVFMRTGETVRLRGPAVPFGALPRFTIESGYALTEVKRDFWERWVEQNKTMDIVKEGLVFCQSDKVNAEAEARDKGRDIMSGLEPLVGPQDRRVEKLQSPNLTDIDIDNDRDAYKHVA